MSPENQPAPASSTSPAFTAEMQAEIDAAMAELDKANAAPAKSKSPAAIRGPRVIQSGREHRTGRVVSVGPTDVFIEFGPKELGVVSRTQYTPEQLPAVGDSVEVVVDKFEASESLFVCSRPGSVQKAAWEMLEAGQVVEARVTGVASKDGKQVGLELELGGHGAFMPAGQVAFEHVADLSVFVGEKLKCVVTRVDRSGRGNVVVSRREVLAHEREEKAEQLKGTLAEGQTLTGTVRKIMDFGCFVDIGGIDGLVHFTDISYDRVNFGAKNVAKFVQEGQSVNVRILKLDWDNKRISLGLKQTQSDPFQTAANSVAEGAEVTGRVTKIMDFGCFVEVGPGVEGLVHISELDHRRVAAVGDVVKVDEIVRAKVIKIDKDSRRISLSIKAMKPLPEVTMGGGAGGPGKGGKGKRGTDFGGRTVEEIKKETPALRRAREKAKMIQFKGGLG
ncbi:MAG: S1 RNA-binding domain-containing protein [Phycisphaerales bacterium]|nr:S1 RNA-binding domain-containing protein [Phycisphaerales bacterium]